MLKTSIYILFGLFFNIAYLSAQTLITDNNGHATINSNAALELRSSSNDKGMILPKVALQASNLAAPFSAHLIGMTIYNTATSGTGNNYVQPGVYYNDGSKWLRMEAITPIVGDIKHAIETSNHGGWYLLNGQNISTLPTIARNNAIALGLLSTGVLPNFAGNIPKTKSTSESLFASANNNNITIAKTNLPNITFNGTTTSAGAHTHNYNDRAAGVFNGAEFNSFTAVDNNNQSTRTTSSSGAHTHTYNASSGTAGSSIPLTPPFMITNMFIYLGF